MTGSVAEIEDPKANPSNKDISVENIDRESELSKIISAEKNRQLNQFSVIHYKKIENKSYVKEF